MSLLVNLMVIANTQEYLKNANLLESGVKGISEVIKYALNKEELKELRWLLDE